MSQYDKGRRYGSFGATLSTSAAKALAVIESYTYAGSGCVVKLVGFELSQITNKGDAQEQQLQIAINRWLYDAGGAGDYGFNATSGVDPVMDCAAELDLATYVYIGADPMTMANQVNDIEVYSWNTRAPLRIIYPEECRQIIGIGSGGVLEIELETAPASSITLALTAWLERTSS